MAGPPRSIDFYTRQVGHRGDIPVFEVDMPRPHRGLRGYMIEAKGIYSLSRCAGVLATLACTHCGSGGLRLVDGVVQPNGFVEGATMMAWPQIMSLWMLFAGFDQGLVVEATGGFDGTPVFLSLGWAEQGDRGC